MSAVGSLKEDLDPGTFVIVDQFIDKTFARKKSFFTDGCVAPVSMAHPVCSRLGDHLNQGAIKSGIKVVRNGTYLVMEGPNFLPLLNLSFINRGVVTSLEWIWMLLAKKILRRCI